MGVYLSNGDFLPGGDQEGNMLFSINLLKRHSLSLGPLDAPTRSSGPWSSGAGRR